jgi:hypothetical protein
MVYFPVVTPIEWGVIFENSDFVMYDYGYEDQGKLF